MRQTLVLWKFVVITFGLFAIQAHAFNDASRAETGEAETWLKKIQSTAQKLNYSGIFVYQQGSQVRTSRITHMLQGQNEVEKLEILDGKPREYVRNNEEITYYVPESKTLLVERRVIKDVFPSILVAPASELADYYNIRKGELGRVAGFDCQAVILEPKDNLRYGYKLWAEKTSGLLLRAQTLNEHGVVVEQIAFTQVEIGNIDRARVKTSFTNTQGWRVEDTVMSRGSLSGWSVKIVPPGFRKVHEVIRLVSDTHGPNSGASSNHSARREVAQIVFSDGMAAISVFIEPGTQSRTEGSMQQGAMNIVGKRQGDFWLTIVGEVPAAAIRQVANSVEFKSQNLDK